MSFSLVETRVPGEKPLQVAPCINELTNNEASFYPGTPVSTKLKDILIGFLLMFLTSHRHR